jgi:hypothetical protein
MEKWKIHRTPKVRDHVEYLGIDGRIILKLIVQK